MRWYGLRTGRSNRLDRYLFAWSNPFEVFATILDASPIHGRDKGSCPMGRMQRDEIQVAALNVLQYALCRFILYFALPYMAPPHDHIGPFQISSRESLFSIV